jgi:hypothetical protein
VASSDWKNSWLFFWYNSGVRRHVFYCFSPPVMALTLLVELALAGWVFVRYRRRSIVIIATIILVLLAAFQLAEFHICTAGGTLGWARLGFVAITFLPVLALDLAGRLIGRRRLVPMGYCLAAAFVTSALLMPTAVSGAICGGNYVIFSIAPSFAVLYGLYYFGFLIAGISFAVRGMMRSGLPRPTRDALGWLAMGYLSFMVPTGIAYAVSVPWRAAVPSVMCGFAILFALILALRVVPLAMRRYPKMVQ